MAAKKTKNKSLPTPGSGKKRRILSYLVLFSTILLLLFTILVSFTQTSIFRNWLSGYILDKLNEGLSTKGSSLQFASLQGNLFSEVIVNNAVLKVKDDEMIRFDRIKVDYKIFRLLDKVIYINDVMLTNPSVNFVKVIDNRGDSVWNFAYVFSSEEEEEEEKGEFEWKINIDRLRIENLNYLMLGAKPLDVPVSAFQITTSPAFNPENLKISGFNLETGVIYDKNSVQLKIGHLGFGSNFGFQLNGLSGEFYLSKARAEINKLNIETQRSWIQMEYALVDRLNLFEVEGLESFKGKDVRLSLDAKKFDFDDLTSFLTDLDFMDGTVSTEVKVSGKFNDLKIEKCMVRTENSRLEMRGRMMNLTEPENLAFDVTSDEMILNPSDTKIHLPGLQIPDYSHLGTVTGSVTYSGEPLDFHSSFDLSSQAGDASGSVDLNLKTSAYNYSSSVETKNLNIGRILNVQELESSLNSKIEVQGSGFSFANMQTKVTYEMTDSRLSDYSVDRSSGRVSINNYNVDCDLVYSDGDFTAGVSGSANISDLSKPKYEVKGSVANLDISEFTKDPSDRSDLDFTFDIRGSGYSPDEIQGNYKFNVGNSYYADYRIPATPVNLEVSRSGTGNMLTLNTDLFELRVRGIFSLGGVADVVAENVRGLMNGVSGKLSLDSLSPVVTMTAPPERMDFDYEFRTKETGKILTFGEYKFDGEIKGRLKNSAGEFSSENEFSVRDFVVSDSVFVLKNVGGSIGFANDYSRYSGNDILSFSSHADVVGEHVKYGASGFDSLKFTLSLAEGLQTFGVSLKQDTSLNMNLAGSADFSGETLGLRIKELSVKYFSFSVGNLGDIEVDYAPPFRNFTFNKFALSSDGLSMELNGLLSLSGRSDITMQVNNISIPKLYTFMYDPKAIYQGSNGTEYSTPLNGEIRRLSVSFTGDAESPEMSIEMNTGMIRYEKTKIGRVNAFVDFRDNTLFPDIHLNNALGQGYLKVSGEVPFENPLVKSDSLTHEIVLRRPLELNLMAREFQLNFFSKIIPEFAEVRGFLDGDMYAKGTVEEPLLSGNMEVTKGRFLLDMNGMYYRFTTRLRAEGSDLVVDNFRIYNIDNYARHLDIWGRINIAKLRINNIDLASSGDIYILDRTSTRNMFGFYGTILAGPGDPPISINGNLDRLYIKGQLLIKKASLVFPSIQTEAYNIYADDFVYKIIKDTVSMDYIDTVVTATEGFDNVDPFLRYKTILTESQASVANNIVYDIEVKTANNIFVSINFNQLTREELFGELKGRIKIDNEKDNQFQFFGNLDIVGDSYYRFYKNFKIQNSQLVFMGPPDDPSLNIHAVYTNVRSVSDAEGTRSEQVDVILDITGTRYKPELSLKIKDEHGSEITGKDAHSNALSYLIFGVPVNALSAGTSYDIAKNLGKSYGYNYLSSLLLNTVRDIAPFILSTEVIYSEGEAVKGADIRITSEVGDAIVKFGGKILTDISNAEVSVEYPLNKLLGIKVSNNLILEMSRVVDDVSSVTGEKSVSTGIKLTYKIRY